MYKEFKKITLATVKSFINRYREQLHIRCDSRFNGMSDMVESIEGAAFHPIKADDRHTSNLGISGAHFVGSSRDYFTAFEDDQYTGIEVYNSCGSFVLAIKKGVTLNATEYKKQITPPAPPVDGKLATCRINSEKHGIELYFTGKPSSNVLDDLKANGFRWGKTNRCWYRQDNSISRKVASKYADVPSEEVNQDAAIVDAQEQAAIANGNY